SQLERGTGGETHVLLGGPRPRDEVGRSGEPADLPPGAVEHLGGAGDAYRPLAHPRQRGDGDVLVAVEGQVLVDLVRDRERVELPAQGGELGQVLPREHGPGRIVRRVEQYRPGAGRERLPQRVHVETVGVPGADQSRRATRRPGHGDGRGVAVV